MRKFLILNVIACIVMTSFAQVNSRGTYNTNRSGYNEQHQDTVPRKGKGSYLSVSGNMGSSALKYDVQGLREQGTRDSKLGYGFELKYSYFFNEHWGVTTGVGMSQYSSIGKMKGSIAEDTYYKLGAFVDDDLVGRPIDFELRARLTNLEEKQTVWFVEIPLMLSYQTYFGDSTRWGMYGGLGAKLQFPASAKFKIQNGTASQFNVSGQYDGIPTDMGSPENPPVPQHGYGTITDPNSTLSWDDKAKLKMGIAATAELGLIYTLSNEMDLMIGGYIDYGFNNIKKKGKNQLLTASSAYHPGADSYVGKGITYHGMLNSTATDKIKLISFGGKITLRFKL